LGPSPRTTINAGFFSIPDLIESVVILAQTFSFKVKDLEANDFTFPTEQFKNKVTIIQIMGTWCPNCMDETNFLRTVYDKYHNKGLEIVSVGYETPNEFSEQVEKIKTLQKRHNLPFTFLVGGKASKALSSEQFSMLNEIISFPTAIIIGRDGVVKRVHTGFNGPGTGKIYTDFVHEMNLFLEKLLEE
jgi:thiol-disulfide isomerase/thioredoxin